MRESFDAVVGTKRQVTLPAGLLRRLSLNEGDHVRFTVDGDSVYLEPMVSVPRHLVSASLLREMNERRGARSNDLSLGEFVAERRAAADAQAEGGPAGMVRASSADVQGMVQRAQSLIAEAQAEIEAVEPAQQLWMTAE